MKLGRKSHLTGCFTKINPIFVLLIIFNLQLVTPMNGQSFKSEQIKFQRVRDAYKENYDSIDILFQNKGIDIKNLEIFLRAIKHEQKLELFAKNKTDNSFQLIKVYSFCVNSGNLGPKREEGDMQVPEGFYYIDRFNPTSFFFLSLGINYPNRSDRKLTTAKYPGGDIFIHGDCVSIGCIPLTDKWIKELYVICTEAKNNGQNKIPVHLFPFQMDNYKDYRLRYSTDLKRLTFWDSLVEGYNYFEKKKQLPKVTIDSNGFYVVENVSERFAVGN